MSNSSDQIHCDNCGTLTETKFRTITLTRFRKTYELEKVETNTCPNCDNFYLSAETIDKCYEAIDVKELVAA